MSESLSKKTSGGTREQVRVVCRVRPQNSKELSHHGVNCVKVLNDGIEVNSEEGQYNFQFDRVFGQESEQKGVFEDTATPLIKDVLSGYNATIFAYGQTGCGKTHTMEGIIHDSNLKGIIPRSVEALFEGVGEADENIEFTFKVSYIEIYMEKIRDLLDDTRLKVNLAVREDKIKGLYVAGVTEEYVTSVPELLDIMAKGSTNRATAATGMNEGSSRSHSVFTVTVTQRNVTNNGSKSGKLVLVDLAGSETVKKTGASGQQLEEAKTINKSLSALGGVINALTDEKNTHIPYRDSKLTRLLQDSLGGNSKTVLIVAVSPSSFNASETISTLRFGTRAKSIQNKVTINQTRTVDELEALLSKAEKLLEIKDIEILNLKSRKSVSGTTTEELDKENETLSELYEKIKLLTSDLDDERNESSRKDQENAALLSKLKEKELNLAEASQLIVDSHSHYESLREKYEVVLREKLDLASQVESDKISFTSEISKIKFDLQEIEVSNETLRYENAQLKAEIKEMSGDTMDSRLPKPPSNVNSSKSAIPLPAPDSNSQPSISVSVNEQTSNTETSSTHIFNKISPTLNDLNEYLFESNGAATFVSINQQRLEEQFKNICERFAIADEPAKHLRDIINIIVVKLDNILSSYVSQTEVLSKLRSDYGKRVKDMEMQRGRLEGDLEIRTKKVLQLQLQLDEVKDMNSAKIGSFFSDREKAQMKSLQQRLEQIVAVHRQLLRKFAALELENNEGKKKIQLRDERIRQLENNAKSVTGNLRQQAERHVAELSNLREQIQLLRAEHQKRLDAGTFANINPTVNRHENGPRSVRGGTTSSSISTSLFPETAMKTIRGGNKTGDESPSRMSTSGIFSRFLGTK